MAECCSQCLLALFISLASGPSHSQLHLSPLICLSLPSPPTSGLRKNDPPLPPATHPKTPGLNTLDPSTAVSLKNWQDKRDLLVFSVTSMWHLLTLLRLKICSELLFACVLLFYWPVWTVWPYQLLKTLKQYLQYVSVFVYSHTEVEATAFWL